MDIKKNHRKHFDLECFDKISADTFIDEETGVWLKFHDNGFVQEKVNYLIEDIENERAPLRVHSYNEHPSEVCYDINGDVININYSNLGKFHSVGGKYLFSSKNGISYWINGVRNDNAVKKIFDFFNVPFDRSNANKILVFTKIFYKSPEKINEFLELMTSLEISSLECDQEKIALLEMSYF